MKKRPSLVYLSTVNPTLGATGTTTRGKLFVRQLAKHFEIHLVCFTRADEGKSEPEMLKVLAGFHPVPFSSAGYFLFSPNLYRMAAQVIDQVKPKFVFADFEKAGLYARFLKYGRRFDYLYNSHDVEFQRYVDLARQQPIRFGLVPWMYFAERFGSGGAALTIAISGEDSTIFRRWNSDERVLVMPAAFDEEKFHPFGATEPTDRPTILMVGNFAYSANVEGARAVVERVIPAVVDRYPDALFRFVGREFPADLKHANLESAGFVDDLLAEYRRATVVLVPIESGGGIKIKLVEALACGCNVVATPKAMQGIEGDVFDCLRIGDLGRFAELILDSLGSETRQTQKNWEDVRAQFGSRTQVTHIAELIKLLSMEIAQA